MNTSSVSTVLRKELRNYFLSPVALMFLGAFLTTILFLVFTYAKFFARNIADVRPMFNWLPVLLIFLVAAVTMRQWSEEQKMGTLEILMTLPVSTSQLVFGKFLAGMMLVALALGLTLPLPLSVSWLGPLDWGPVVGGYAAAFLMASTYMALGLCVSARTDNQIVSLMMTVLFGLLLYLIGSDAVTTLFGHEAAETLRLFGTGSRFESIERGVLDLRDIVYYLSLTGFFLVLNVYFLEDKRMEVSPKGGVGMRKTWGMTLLLVLLNCVAANLWLHPVHVFRADLTANGEYSISNATRKILDGLEEPLEIKGYFSEKTHPLLSPLVPRIRNLIKEYEVLGGGNVITSFQDPNRDEEIEREIGELYNIKSVPFRVASRHEKSVVNSYFHVLIKYGDKHEVLSFDDLIEVYADENEIQVRLKNLEYDLTRAIKKATQGFQSIDSLLARSKGAKLTAYVTAGNLPQEFKEVPSRIEKVAKELTEKSGGSFQFEMVDPSGNQALMQELHQKYGFRPMAVDLFGTQRFYLHLLFESGEGHTERIFPQGELTEGNLRTNIESAIRRSTPGFLKTIGLFTEKPAAPPMGMMMPQMSPPADYQMVEKLFSQDFQVRRLDLKDGVVPGDIDVLIVAKPGVLDDKQRFAIDQYLMRGGSILVLTGAYDVDGELKTKATDQGLLEMLKTYGVEVEKSLVMDPMNSSFPVPEEVRHGPFVMQRIRMMPYPFFPDIRKDGFKEDHLALAGIPSISMSWASPMKVDEKLEGRSAQELLKTSPKSWVTRSTTLQPDFNTYPDGGFLQGEAKDIGRKLVAATVTGTFPSHFAEKPSPLFDEAEEAKEEDKEESAEASDATTAAAEAEEAKKADRTGRTLKASTPDARLIVVSSSAFCSDMIAQLGFRMGTDSSEGNLVLVRNLVDWSLEDTDLLEIRSTGSFARTLRPMKPGERTTFELANYVIVLLALGIVLGVAMTRRSLTAPIQLLEPSEGGK